MRMREWWWSLDRTDKIMHGLSISLALVGFVLGLVALVGSR